MKSFLWKGFLFFVALLGRFISFVVRIVSAVLSPASYEPVLRMIDEVVSQVMGVKYIFDKRPCSATGGTA